MTVVQIRKHVSLISTLAALSVTSLMVLALCFNVGEQSLPAAGFAPLLPVPAPSFSLPYSGEVFAELKAGQRTDMLSAIAGLDRGSVKDRAQAAANVKRHQSSLSLKGQVLVRLMMARGVAGLSAAGHRVSGANAAYRGQLAAALQKAAGLGDAERLASLAYGLSIWRLAEGKTIDWSKPPFRLAPYSHTILAKAIVERAALDDLRGGRPEVAVKKYKALAASLERSPQRAPLDLRVLDLSHLVAVKAKQNKVYENALTSAYKAYLDPGLLGEGNEAQVKLTAQDISQRHATFVSGLLRHAASSSSSGSDSAEAVRMAQNFLTTLSDAAAIEGIKSRIATAYMAHRQYAEAVGVYKELADTKDQTKASGYIALAIRAQGKLAAWPDQAPWGGVAAGHGAEREDLLALYARLGGAKNANNAWFVAAQRGLLSLNLGRRDEAFDLWQGLLRKNAAGAHAANAAGMMLTTYQGETLWQDLDSLARLCLASHLAPTYHGKVLNVGDMLALALLESGKQAYAQQQYGVAIKKFAEVVREHAGFKRTDEALFMLASAYHGDGRHIDGVKTLLTFVDKYPRSTFYRQALLNGGDWSAPMAYEDNTIFFFNRFVMQFGQDAEAQRVRHVLTGLYIGLGRYGDALGVLRLTASHAPDPATKAEALVTTLDLQSRHGSSANAGVAAAAVIGSADTSLEGKAAALATQVRLAASAGHFKDVERLAAMLATSDHPAAQEALGEARYLIAESMAKSAVHQDYNLGLSDPSATLQARYKSYKTVRQRYIDVCGSGVTSFCAPAMVRLDQFSVTFAKAADEIEIQDSLAATVVQRFRNAKQAIMNDVADTSQRAEARALASTEAGQTDPSTTEAVLWQASTEFSVDHLSGAAGQGYVQWNAE